MPFSGINRFTNKWEPVLWFTKKPSGYYFDLDAVREIPKAWSQKPQKSRNRKGQTKIFEGERRNTNLKQDNTPMADGRPDPTKAGFNDRWRENLTSEQKKKNPGDFIYLTTKPFPDAHYATYPVELPLFYISCMCPQNGIVLDPFAGSGTTAEAAEKIARKWILIEGSPENESLIRKRIGPFLSEKLC